MRTEHQLDLYTEKEIKLASRKLAKATGLDGEDLEQEVTLYFLENLPRYQPERSSWKTFVARVLKSFRLMFLRKHLADKRRSERSTLSLSDPIFDKHGKSTERQESLVAPQGNSLSPEVAEVIDGLSSELRTVCTALMHGGEVYARKALGLSWRQLEVQRRNIRRAFMLSGFDQMGF